MLTVYMKTPQGLRKSDMDALAGNSTCAVWVDLYQPNQEEERQVEVLLGLDIPTREELQEIELSSRLFVEGHAQFMTASLMCKADTDRPQTSPVTFVLTGNALVTVRYDAPRPFVTFPAQAERHQEIGNSSLDVLSALLDAIVDRTADVLERLEREVDALSTEIFASRAATKADRAGAIYKEALQKIGRNQMVALKIGESLVSIGRLVAFLSRPREDNGKLPKGTSQRLKTLQRDISSLTDHTGHLANTITFMLDAVLGLMQSEENTVIKIFSIMAVVFLPPTLVGTIYGMNFKHMPELDANWGYPLALLVMVLSALLPVLYFRRKGWF